MMNSAVKSASRAIASPVAWAYSRLATTSCSEAHSSRADAWPTRRCSIVPDYARALLARGRIRARAEEIHRRVADARAPRDLNPLPEYQWTLADALRGWNRR
jgi:hypothetical protein